ncbi:MAG TPA: TRAP transporter substrate-binding protein DctP [Candidatus Acidoferrum sp.]|nr:TRAP transporter substrate-binding protein DctP [Candidatus Acidoferrum sp.]
MRVSIRNQLKNSGSLMIAAVLLTMGFPSNSAAQTEIKLATMVPSGTSYHHSLQALGEKWRKDSNGAIALRIYPDGTMGGEAEIVRRMRVGQLQAAVLTVEGLSEIDSSVSALQKMPLMYRSLDEAAYVRARLAPDLERRLAAKGFVVLFWTDAGWVRIFSKEPGILPEDFKKMKIFVTAGDNALSDLYKSAGFQPVLLEWVDVLAALQTGMVDAVPTIPFHTLAGQFYLSTHNMLEVNWLPLVGALVMTKRSWDALPPSEREAMLKSAADCGQEFQARGRQENQEAVEAMQKRGLQVHAVNKEAEEEWRRFSENLYPQIRGKIVPADMFDQVVQVLRDHRATPGASGK